jgi:FtsP/CotA-like multicopper oxidase with cupredoxin domain
LRLPTEWSGGTLTVALANLNLWPEYRTFVNAINGSMPGPTIRVQRGQEFTARVQNDLDEPLVLHWHGVLAPERMDGHPRDQVNAGQSYQVRFPIIQHAATCWYHAHTNNLTAKQAYRGVAGFFVIEDPAEQLPGLPTGDHDVPLVFTDKRISASRQLVYAPSIRANSGEDCHICEWVATGGIKASESHVAAPGLVPILIPEFAPAPQRERDLPPKQVHLAEWSIPPPDPVGTFLFVCRTALPVRAPTALA